VQKSHVSVVFGLKLNFFYFGIVVIEVLVFWFLLVFSSLQLIVLVLFNLFFLFRYQVIEENSFLLLLFILVFFHLNFNFKFRNSVYTQFSHSSIFLSKPLCFPKNKPISSQ